MSFGKRMRMAREAADMRQNAAALAMGVPIGGLNKIERERPDAPKLNQEQLKQAALTYGVSSDWLLGLLEQQHPDSGWSRSELALMVEQVVDELLRRQGGRRRNRNGA